MALNDVDRAAYAMMRTQNEEAHEAVLLLLRWCGGNQFVRDVCDNKVTASDDSPIGILRRVIARAKVMSNRKPIP